VDQDGDAATGEAEGADGAAGEGQTDSSPPPPPCLVLLPDPQTTFSTSVGFSRATTRTGHEQSTSTALSNVLFSPSLFPFSSSSFPSFLPPFPSPALSPRSPSSAVSSEDQNFDLLHRHRPVDSPLSLFFLLLNLALRRAGRTGAGAAGYDRSGEMIPKTPCRPSFPSFHPFTLFPLHQPLFQPFPAFSDVPDATTATGRYGDDLTSPPTRRRILRRQFRARPQDRGRTDGRP